MYIADRIHLYRFLIIIYNYVHEINTISVVYFFKISRIYLSHGIIHVEITLFYLSINWTFINFTPLKLVYLLIWYGEFRVFKISGCSFFKFLLKYFSTGGLLTYSQKDEGEVVNDSNMME